MRECEERSVHDAGDFGVLHRRLDQRYVLPTVGFDPLTRPREHVRTLVDGDDTPLWTNGLFQQRKSEAGAATRVDDGLTRLQLEMIDRPAAKLGKRPARTA